MTIPVLGVVVTSKLGSQGCRMEELRRRPRKIPNTWVCVPSLSWDEFLVALPRTAMLYV